MTIPRLTLPRPLPLFSKAVLLAVGLLISQGCGPDMGPPPDENAKNNPPVPDKEPQVRGKGVPGTLKVKNIKDRS